MNFPDPIGMNGTPSEDALNQFPETLILGKCATPDEGIQEHPETKPVEAELSVIAPPHAAVAYQVPGADASQSASGDETLPPGSRLGAYRVIDVLNHGGMGVVYLAEHEVLRVKRVLKVISRRLIKSPEEWARFIQEARTQASLKDPGIVQALDYGVEKDVSYLVMEYVEGSDLNRWVQERGPLPVLEAVEYTCQAARLLGFAHRNNVVHRDIKPANLMRTPDGIIRILDFGLALATERTQLGFTQPGVLMGTFGCMAPEQAANAHLANARSDLFSLGCVLFFLLTGKLPFSPRDSISWVLKPPKSLPLPSLPQVPAELKRILGRLMAAQAEQRYGSAEELSGDLDAFLLANNGHRRRRLPKTAFAVTLVSLVVALATWQPWTTRPAQNTTAVPRPRVESLTGTLSLRHDFPLAVKLIGGRADVATGVRVLIDNFPFQVELLSQRDCYVEVWYEDEHQRLTRLYPPDPESPQHFMAGSTYVIPPPEAGFDFRATQSTGAETVHVVASSDPLPPLSNAAPSLNEVVDIDRRLSAFQTRGARVVARSPTVQVTHESIRINRVESQ